MEMSGGVERRRGRRETDLALLAHLSDVLADAPEAVFDHVTVVIERFDPAAWAWVTPGGRVLGRYEHLDVGAARAVTGGTFSSSEIGWFKPGDGSVFRKAWPDGELFLLSRRAEVTGAERWEKYLVISLGAILRGARRSYEADSGRLVSFYARAEAETLQRLESEVRRTRELRLPLSAVMFRLQGVSALNENSGLLAGDRVFVRFAELLRELAGDLAQIGRAGTVGFLVIFPAWGKGSAETWLGLARTTIEERLRAETACAELWLHTRLAEIPADAPDFRELVGELGIKQ